MLKVTRMHGLESACQHDHMIMVYTIWYTVHSHDITMIYVL